jgi:hypothetical protein
MPVPKSLTLATALVLELTTLAGPGVSCSPSQSTGSPHLQYPSSIGSRRRWL